ncbi:kinase-like domain-containing protein [Rhizophagus irregularis DAOM 181602=DAOM 197198]|nr:kinase-like domain-containing protein [Rhizophagus irregularis DAOM 181602=DAOM 197198]
MEGWSINGYHKILLHKYVNTEYEWCKSCQKSYLKNNTNWTSKNKQIDKLLMTMDDTIFERIPYNQFNDIKELSNTTHS